LDLNTRYFDQKGAINTEETINLVVEAVKEFKINTVVIASTTGESALKAAEKFQDSELKLIICKHMDGFRGEGNEFSSEIQEKILEKRPSTIFHTGTHALAGVERSFRLANISQTMLPIEMIAITLRRCFGDGTKVALEMALMVADAGLLNDISHDIICAAGTGRGLDTAWVVRPSYTNELFNLRMKRLICKPLDF